MNDVKSSVSKGESYHEFGEYWDTHDLSEVWDQTQPVDFVMSGHKNTTYYPVESLLSEKLHTLARQRGVSAETLLNLWLQEKITQEAA